MNTVAFWFIVYLIPALVLAQSPIAPTVDQAPNPSLIRQNMLDLTGEWSYQEGENHSTILTPYVPQSKMSGLPDRHDVDSVTYERQIEVPQNWKGGLLHFEGVDYHAQVFLDGEFIGEHFGGYDPFAFDISDKIKNKKSVRLTVQVEDSNDRRSQLVGKQERTPNEGVIFYKNMTGIWKSVWFEEVSKNYVTDLRIETDMNGRFSMHAAVAGSKRERLKATVAMRFENRKVVLEQEVAVRGGKLNLDAAIESPRLWSPESPHLYFIEVVLTNAQGVEVDRVQSYTGFRTFEQKNGYFHLNGKPFQMRGVLDQVIYPDSLYTPTESDILRDIQYSKAAGFNGARIHQTTPTHRRLWHADRLGFWSSIELPSARNLTEPSDLEEAIRQWQNILGSYAYGRPNVFYVVPSNEDWGFLEDHDHWAGTSPEVREHVQHTLFHKTREAAPSNMIISAQDGWRTISTRKFGEEVQGLNANQLMISIHDYRTSEDLRATYGFIPGDAPPGMPLPNNGKPLFLDGYEYDGQTPIVFSEAGGRAVTLNSGARIFAYGSLFQDEVSWSQETANVIKVLGELPIARGGFVLTQLRDAGNDPSDIESGGELNGLLRADGEQKVDAEVFLEANKEAERTWKKNRRRLKRRFTCEQMLAG